MKRRALAVVKFGGTSVATEEGRALAVGHIRALRERGLDAAAVVSAMGRRGQPYATDTLLDLVGSDCGQVTRDLLSSCGETISACVLAHQLTRAGIPAQPMTGPQAGLQTDGVFGSARVTGMDTAPVRSVLDAGLVPVITGFQGAGPDGRITTLGRGGSDTSAVEIGGYLGAAEIVIFTDVPGIAAADPRVWPEAPYLPEVDSGDMLALARWGAKVIHPRAVEAGRRHRVPVWVRSTFDSLPGTVIRRLAKKPSGFLGTAMLRRCALTREDGGDHLRLSAARGGLYALPGAGELAVLTVLCRPLPADLSALPGLSPAPRVFRAGPLAHLVVPDAEASELLRALCLRLTASA
jgi:aspartokinase